MLDMRSKANCRCPTCGSEISLDEIYLSPMHRRILNLVIRHGEIHHEVLWAAIYGSDPNGGPNSLNALRVRIDQLNKHLKPYGRAVKRLRRAAWGEPYRLVRITETAE